MEGRKPFGIRLKPLQSRTIDGVNNKRWKVSSLLKKNNKTTPIIEENEETQFSESDHIPSSSHNSWITPGESTDSMKLTNSTSAATKSPINLWTMPATNGKEVM